MERFEEAVARLRLLCESSTQDTIEAITNKLEAILDRMPPSQPPTPSTVRRPPNLTNLTGSFPLSSSLSISSSSPTTTTVVVPLIEIPLPSPSSSAPPPLSSRSRSMSQPQKLPPLQRPASVAVSDGGSVSASASPVTAPLVAHPTARKLAFSSSGVSSPLIESTTTTPCTVLLDSTPCASSSPTPMMPLSQPVSLAAASQRVFFSSSSLLPMQVKISSKKVSADRIMPHNIAAVGGSSASSHNLTVAPPRSLSPLQPQVIQPQVYSPRVAPLSGLASLAAEMAAAEQQTTWQSAALESAQREVADMFLRLNCPATASPTPRPSNPPPPLL